MPQQCGTDPLATGAPRFGPSTAPDSTSSFQALIARVQLALGIRQGQESQRVQELVRRRAQQLDEQHMRVNEEIMRGMGIVRPPGAAGGGDDVGDINIDSPITICHPSGAAATRARASQLWPALAILGLASTAGVGGAWLASTWARPTPAIVQPVSSTATTIERTHGFVLELAPGANK